MTIKSEPLFQQGRVRNGPFGVSPSQSFPRSFSVQRNRRAWQRGCLATGGIEC